MKTNSDQMKYTYYRKGCPNSHINTQCSSHWHQRRRVFSHENGHKDIECHSAIDCPKHLTPAVGIRQWLWQALVKWARDLGFLLARRVVVHHVASQQPYVNVRCPAEKAHHLLVEEMAVAWS